MGKNIILAHRLMKNNIESDEYLLMTTEFTKLQDEAQMKASMNWSELKEGKISYDHIGEVSYHYIELSSLCDQIKPVKPASDTEKFKNPIVSSTHIDAPMDFVYRIIIDLTLRTSWSEGLKKITYDEKEIPRLGSKHICDLSAGLVELETIQNKRQDNKIEYAEKATKSYIFPKATTIFIIEDDNGETKFSVQFHYKRIFLIGWVIDLILRKKLEKRFQKSGQNLKKFCETEKITRQTQQYT
jgi:hypothetical protein